MPPAVVAVLPGPSRVVLDPRYWGSHPGGVNQTYGLIERDFTLKVARGAGGILASSGYSVALTRCDNATHLGNSELGRSPTPAGRRSLSSFTSMHRRMRALTTPTRSRVSVARTRRSPST